MFSVNAAFPEPINSWISHTYSFFHLLQAVLLLLGLLHSAANATVVILAAITLSVKQSILGFQKHLGTIPSVFRPHISFTKLKNIELLHIIHRVKLTRM